MVAGLQRLEAAKLLGWERMDCIFVNLDDVDRQLWEIDENLFRAELSPAQTATHMKRRAELWEQKIGAETARQTLPTSLSDGRKAGPQHQLGFAADTAAKTGTSVRTISQALQRAKHIAPDLLKHVEGTPLDKGVELDALAKLPDAEQREIVAAVKAGEITSARPVIPPPAAPTPELRATTSSIDDGGLSLLISAWANATPGAQAVFLQEFDLMWTGAPYSPVGSFSVEAGTAALPS